MKIFPLFLLATFALIACTGQMESRKENQTDLAEKKTISLQILDKTIWTWTITPKGVKGNGINLQKQDDVIFGYLNEEKVRFSISTEKLVEGKTKTALSLRASREK
ncbi:MAG: hypothetical protein JRF33_25920 [Deltaproteobacteria bacterium]|nr:hypothetical protein [Deltaproteobacteria bacterium]